MLNVDDPDAGAKELERCVKMGLVGLVHPGGATPGQAVQSARSTTASGRRPRRSSMPLLLHIATPRDGVPANEFTMDVTEMTGAGRSTTDYWVRYSLGSMVFAGVFDKFPAIEGRLGRARGGMDPALAEADGLHLSRAPGLHQGLEARKRRADAERLLEAQHVRRVHGRRARHQMRDNIGVDTMLWGSDFPHAEATLPRRSNSWGACSRAFPRPIGVRSPRKTPRKMFGFELNCDHTARRALALSPAAGGGLLQREYRS